MTGGKGNPSARARGFSLPPRPPIPSPARFIQVDVPLRRRRGLFRNRRLPAITGKQEASTWIPLRFVSTGGRRAPCWDAAKARCTVWYRAACCGPAASAPGIAGTPGGSARPCLRAVRPLPRERRIDKKEKGGRCWIHRPPRAHPRDSESQVLSPTGCTSCRARLRARCSGNERPQQQGRRPAERPARHAGSAA